VLGIHDIWCGSGSGSVDPYLWLTDPDPTPVVSDFKDANKKNSFFHIFYTLTAGTLSSVFNMLL
jgi:hypothetical protein